MFAEDPLKARFETAPTVLLGLCAVVNRAYGVCWVGALCKRASLDARLQTAPTVFVGFMRGCKPRLRCWVGALCKRASLDARL